MHQEVRDFVLMLKMQFPEMFVSKRVLECGSYNINGTVRDYFDGCYYRGLDIHDGDGVDYVVSIVEYFNQERTQWDVVICSEALEHDREWKESWLSMVKMLAPGGLMIMTCAGPERAEHGTTAVGPNLSPATNDYYGNRRLEDFYIPPHTFKTVQYVRGKKDVNIAFKL